MTVLSDRDLIQLNKDSDGNQPLSPFLPNQRVDDGLPSFGLSSVGYDIRLANEFIEFTDNPHPWDVINLKDTLHAIQQEHRTRKVIITYDEAYLLKPQGFVLAKAIENFDVPDNIMGSVTDKSTWARNGITVQNTIIEPGWKGQLTLEICNHNNRPVILYPGCGIAQVVFMRTSSVPLVTYADRKGKYMNQQGVTLSR